MTISCLWATSYRCLFSVARALCIRSVIQNKLVVTGWGVVTGLEGWWGVRGRSLSGYMAEIVALSCEDAKIGQNSQKAVFPTFSLFPVILALLYITWRRRRTKFSPVSLHNTFREYTKAVILQKKMLQGWCITWKKAGFPSFLPSPAILALFYVFDVGGSPKSRQFHFITPLQSIPKQWHGKKCCKDDE